MRENVTELLKRLEDTQKGETICLKHDDVRKILQLLTDHGKTEITGNTLDTETILDGLDHMAVACEGLSCDVCRFKNKKKTEPFTCAMDEANIAENAARLIEDQAERIAIMSEHGLWIPVEERLPKSMANKVLVWLEHDDFVGKMAYGHYEKYKGVEEWYDLELLEPFSNEGYRVSYWMEAPEPPKEGEA